MEYTTISHDIETINNRIRRGQIKMDSDFQRGEVWGPSKKQKLVDTILRRWPIPPIQIVKINETEEILDGLQRVTSIVEFLKGNFPIDGNIEPIDDEIKELNGLTFKEIEVEAEKDNNPLFKKFYNIILSTSISAYYIQNPTSEEIAELFYRFNSPMQLNPVEKRNAFMGETRTTIKNLNKFFVEKGANKENLGFNDIRGLYEDILVKVCYFYEFPERRNTKLTTDKLIELYRENYIFSEKTISSVHSSIELFFEVITQNFEKNQIKLSRTTVFSILLFICNNIQLINFDTVYKVISFLIGQIELNSELYRSYWRMSTTGTTDALNINLRETILYIVAFLDNDTIYGLDKDEFMDKLLNIHAEYMKKIKVISHET